MTTGPFREPPNLELLTREQLIEAVKLQTASLNKLAGMIGENHKMLERVARSLGAPPSGSGGETP